MSVWTHGDLCNLAVKWLKRPQSNNGHGCCIAFSEVRSGWSGEVPDAIGFRRKGGGNDGSVVVEVKVTRSDFLVDAKKPHRSKGGLGNWRYYMCPEGLILPDEIPEGWGLLWVNSRGHIKPKAGPSNVMASTQNWLAVCEALTEFRKDSDQDRELFIVVKMLARVGDPEKVNAKLRAAWGAEQRLARKCDKQDEQIRRLNRRLGMMNIEVKQ